MSEIGLLLTRTRRKSGLTQDEVAKRMGTTQSVISRAETGQVLPSLEFIQRFADATGQTISIELRPGTKEIKRADMRRRVRKATDGFVFNPWDREPTEAEAKSLVADGLTRERFESGRTTRTS